MEPPAPAPADAAGHAEAPQASPVARDPRIPKKTQAPPSPAVAPLVPAAGAPPPDAGLPPGLPPSVPSGVPSGEPPGVPSGVPPGVPSGVPSGEPSGVPSGVSSGVPSGVSSGVPSGVSSGIPSGVPSGVPSGDLTGAPSDVSASVPSGVPLAVVPQINTGSLDDGAAAAPLVLPDGITLPATVTPDMLDGRLRRLFLDLTPSQMRDVLEEYDDAVREKGHEIRNRNAYLFGVVKRYRTLIDGGPDASQGRSLSAPVIARLNALVASGFCTAEEIDAKLKARMRMLPEKDALDAIDEMNGCSRAEIRNFGSYFMGIMNRYRRGERQNPMARAGNRGNGNHYGQPVDYRATNNQAGLMGNGQGSMGGNQSFSHYGGGQSFSHYGRSDGHQSHQSSQYATDPREGRYGRDRRRDEERDHRHRRRRSRSSSYSRSRSRSPDHRRRRSRSRSNSRERYHPDGRHRSSRRGSSSRRDAGHGVSAHLSKGRYGQGPGLPPPPPPPPRPQNAVQQLGVQPMMPGGLPLPPAQQQQLMQSLGQIQGQAQLGQHQLGQHQLGQHQLGQHQLGQPQLGQPQLGQLQLGQLQPGQLQPGQPQPGQGQNNPAHMQAMLLPQMGQPGQNNAQQLLLQQQFANVPGMTSQAKPPFQQFGQNPPQQNPAGQNQAQQVNTAALTNLLLGQGSQQTNGLGHIDILGLADKAAQALSGVAHLSTQQGNSNFPPTFPPPSAAVHPFQQQQPVVAEKDLPMMVQYAVQNLRTTGHLDQQQQVDSNLCMMLKKMPEHDALRALEIFSSCDLSKMRNRSSYLAGILKKELIKLGLGSS